MWKIELPQRPVIEMETAATAAKTYHYPLSRRMVITCAKMRSFEPCLIRLH